MEEGGWSSSECVGSSRQRAMYESMRAERDEALASLRNCQRRSIELGVSVSKLTEGVANQKKVICELGRRVGDGGVKKYANYILSLEFSHGGSVAERHKDLLMEIASEL